MFDQIDLTAALKADHCSIDTINETLAGITDAYEVVCSPGTAWIEEQGGVPFTPAGNPWITRAFIGALGANGGRQQ